MLHWLRPQRGNPPASASGRIPVAIRLAMGVCLISAGGLGNADVVYWKSMSSEDRREPADVVLATMTQDVGREMVSDDVNITDITIGSEIGTDAENVFMQAARACGLNPIYTRPFLLGQNCMVGPVNDPDSGSDECRILGFTFICIEE